MQQLEIVTIGDELLIGQVVDTNSAWMGRKLGEAGLQVSRITSVSDREDDILSILNESTARSKVVLITGGLGPTRDDITKHTLCKFFNTQLVFNQEVFSDIEAFLKGRVHTINYLNRQQAMVPEQCTVIRNKMGTAPVMWFNRSDGGVVVSMPGVPGEMKNAMEFEIMPRLKKIFEPGPIIHKTIQVYNVPEAELAEKLTDWENHLPHFVRLAYLPSPGRIRLRLSGGGKDRQVIEKAIQKSTKDLYSLIGDQIFAEEDKPVAELFAEFFSSTKKTVALAESCSGGYLSHLLTSIPGASAYFKGSFIAYSNLLKEKILNVNPDFLRDYGAVSREVAGQMAMGALTLSGADYAIATTGIAGPGGGSAQKPVGTVWIAWASAEKNLDSRVYNFGTNRNRVITRTSETALIELMQMIKQRVI